MTKNEDEEDIKEEKVVINNGIQAAVTYSDTKSRGLEEDFQGEESQNINQENKELNENNKTRKISEIRQ